MRWVDTLPIIFVIFGVFMFAEDDPTPANTKGQADMEKAILRVKTAPRVQKRSKMAALQSSQHQLPPVPLLPTALVTPRIARVSQSLEPVPPAQARANLTPLKVSLDTPLSAAQKPSLKAPLKAPLKKILPAHPDTHQLSEDTQKFVDDALSPMRPKPPINDAGDDQGVKLLTGLSLLETASEIGLDMEIAWPEGAGDRQNLFNRLNQCYGFTRAVMGHSGKLYGKIEDLATRSPFLRQLQRGIDPDGSAEKTRLVKAYQIREPVELVYLMDRQSDAFLLGHLAAYIQQSNAQATQIRGKYAIQGDNIRIENLQVNHVEIPHGINLTASQCRG